MLKLSVEVEDRSAREMLRDVAAHLRYARPAWEQVGVHQQESFRRQIAGRQITPGLKEATVRRRRRGTGAGSPVPLRDRSLLMQSLGGGASSILNPERDGVVVGTRLGYAGYHYHGTRHMDARFPEVTARDMTRHTATLLDYVLNG